MNQRYTISEVSLGEIVENVDAKRVPLKKTDRAARNGKYAYYGASGVIDYVDSYLYEGPHLLVGEDGANLLARTKPVAFIAEGKFWVNNHAHVLKATEHADLNYLARFVESIDLSPFVTGTAQPKLTRKALDRIRVPLPPLAEQKRIAAILDKADAIRKKRKQAIELTEQLLRATFLEMFGDPVTNPKGWDVVELGSTFAARPQIGTTTPAHSDGVQIVIRVGELGSNRVRLENCGKITLSSTDLKKFRCVEGDLLLARAIGSEHQLGKSSIMQKTDDVTVFDSHVMRLRFSPEKILPLFFRTWLQSKGGRALFMQQAGRTAVQFNVNAQQIAKVKIPLPPIALQTEFEKFTVKALSFDRRLESIYDQQFKLFSGLSQRAFRGEL